MDMQYYNITGIQYSNTVFNTIYVPFIVTIKYWIFNNSHFVQYILVAYLILNSLYLLLLHFCIARPPSLCSHW